jgi:hypothetical protein
MIEIVRYRSENIDAWDNFVLSSRNGTFMLTRNYIEYHSDRFTDHSLLIYYTGKLVAVLPANETGNELHSHGGLSYGGLVYGAAMKAALAVEVIKTIMEYLKRLGFTQLFYKVIPHIYHTAPAEEDLYALHNVGAQLVRRDVNSVIVLGNKLPYSQLRKRKLKDSQTITLEIRKSTDYSCFMALGAEVLRQKYNLKPVHTTEEITHLATLYPDNIKLYGVYRNGVLMAGTIVFETSVVAHCQYIAASETGKAIAALDYLFHHLITEVYTDKKYFSFGISTEQEGQYLNQNLVRNKESYGARTIVHDFYELKL